ncbi:MAG TPA: dihydrolipoamide acetyltransferase family protein [Chloroflexota bacterium]|nr:dihydrolipoamide acetyltransferase family protein [Chloroflexota bacterium]
MATSITMPQLGESVTEGVISRWLKAEGDHVERDESLVEIVTDKVNAEMPSPVAGTLVKIIAPEGATIPVGGELAEIEVDAAVPSGAAASTGSTGATAPAQRDSGAAAWAEPVAVGTDAGSTREETVPQRRYSPVVRRLAQEHHLDLSQISGTGLGGRVTKDDVLQYIAERQAQPAAQAAAEQATGDRRQATEEGGPLPPAAPLGAANAARVPEGHVAGRLAPAVVPAPAPAARADEEYLPLTPMRKAIAEHMVRSVQTAPHATAVVEVDMTPLVRWREANREAARARHGVDMTYVAFVVQAVVGALKAVPIMNSSWGEDKIILKRRINVGVAVGLEDGIVVPVIHDADEKSIVGLARAVDDLVQRARTNRLTLQDMQGGTFTVNNVGVFGVVTSTPVINQPQAAILAMNAIVKRPVVVDDAIAIRAMMNLCLSFDHRIVDGLTAGRFLERVVQNIRGLDLSNL